MGALTTAEAYDALSNFASSYGPDPLLLLLHASVPETLRPDILHLIQINFLAGPADPSREADVLFAPFTTCLGGDYYRIDAQVRWHGLTLLRSLYREEPRGREVRVAELLWCHLEQLERGQRITAQTLLGDYIAVQRWVALAYLEPSDAARAFAQALQAVEAQSSADSSADSITAYAQLGGLAAALELPLAGEPELLTYAKGLDALAKGDEPSATRLLEALGDQPLQIGEVSLKAPTQWLGQQVEEQLQLQLEEQKKRELIEQQRQAEEVLNATRPPVRMTNNYPDMYNHNKLDIRKFFQATNPDRALFADNNKEDRNYYIDFSSVRGGQVIEDLKKNILFFSPDEPTCQLLTGHIGCGISTELQKLKVELQQEGFHVVYFDSLKDLEMSDLDVSDIMLAIIHRVSESLENAGIKVESNYFKSLFADIKNSFLTPVNMELKLSFLIAEITTQTQASPNLRTKLRDVLEPKISKILEEINAQILKPGIKELKRKQQKGLVVIVDSFEKIDNVAKHWGRPQHEYLFIDRGMALSSLDCHLVYTMPLSLRFSMSLSFSVLTPSSMSLSIHKSPSISVSVSMSCQFESQCQRQ